MKRIGLGLSFMGDFHIAHEIFDNKASKGQGLDKESRKVKVRANFFKFFQFGANSPCRVARLLLPEFVAEYFDIAGAISVAVQFGRKGDLIGNIATMFKNVATNTAGQNIMQALKLVTFLVSLCTFYVDLLIKCNAFHPTLPNWWVGKLFYVNGMLSTVTCDGALPGFYLYVAAGTDFVGSAISNYVFAVGEPLIDAIAGPGAAYAIGARVAKAMKRGWGEQGQTIEFGLYFNSEAFGAMIGFAGSLVAGLVAGSLIPGMSLTAGFIAGTVGDLLGRVTLTCRWKYGSKLVCKLHYCEPFWWGPLVEAFLALARIVAAGFENLGLKIGDACNRVEDAWQSAKSKMQQTAFSEDWWERVGDGLKNAAATLKNRVKKSKLGGWAAGMGRLR